MNKRIRKKRKQQLYVEGLERGNCYLKDVILRAEAVHQREKEGMQIQLDAFELLVFDLVVRLGGDVSVELKGLKESLGNKDIRLNLNEEAHTVYITVKEKEQA